MFHLSKIILAASLLLGSSLGIANEKITLKIQGMHCRNCVKSLTKKICSGESLPNCTVNLIDQKGQVGEIVFDKKDGQDLLKIKGLIESAGYTPID